MTDRSGDHARVSAEKFSHALDPPVGDRTRQLLLSDITIPLAAFDGVDLERIRSVGLGFGVRGRRHGQVQLADLAFQDSSDGALLRRPGPAPADPVPEPGPGTAVDAIRLATAGAGTGCADPGDVTVVSGPESSDGRLLLSGVLEPDACQSRIQVALFERQEGSCRFLSADGGLGPAQDCDRPVSLIVRAGEGGAWSLSLPWQEGTGLPEVSAMAVPETFPTG